MNKWEILSTVEKSIDYAFNGKIVLNMYEYLKSIKATKNDVQEFLKSSTVQNINFIVFELEDYLEGGSDSSHKQLREAYGYLGKTQARKVKDFLQSLIIESCKYEHEKRSGRRKKLNK